jgi:hypothetical protein
MKKIRRLCLLYNIFYNSMPLIRGEGIQLYKKHIAKTILKEIQIRSEYT